MSIYLTNKQASNNAVMQPTNQPATNAKQCHKRQASSSKKKNRKPAPLRASSKSNTTTSRGISSNR
jgi:hypothetical protein